MARELQAPIVLYMGRKRDYRSEFESRTTESYAVLFTPYTVSGCGKTTFLDLLTGRRKKGQIKVLIQYWWLSTQSETIHMYMPNNLSRMHACTHTHTPPNICTHWTLNTHKGGNLCQWYTGGRGTRLVCGQHRLCPPVGHTLLWGADSAGKSDPSCTDTSS